MIGFPKRPRKAATIVTAVAATALLASSGPTVAAMTATNASPDHRPKCITFDYVEPTTIVASNVPLDNPVPALGTQVALLDKINDWSGKEVGSSIAAVDILYVDQTTGHQMEESTETMNFPDGELFSGGVYDRHVMLDEMAWVSAPIEGIGGRYLGYSGTFYWRLMSKTDPWPVEDKVVVCRH